MKRNLFTFIGLLLATIFCFGQKLPKEIQNKLDTLKDSANTRLENYRTNPYIGKLYTMLCGEFVYPDSLWKKVEYDRYKLRTGMIYDEKMRQRIVQLMQNEFREDELDTLVNRSMQNMLIAYESEAMKVCKFDTLLLFKNKLDSLYLDLEHRNAVDFIKKHNGIYDFEVFKSLKLDTTTLFKRTYENLIKEKTKERRLSFLSNTYYNHTDIGELCGYIGDKRFIEPLVKALNKPNNFRRDKIIEALVRIHVEPYYSEYVKKRIVLLEKLKDKEYNLNFKIEDLVYVIRTQESFLELSKYLLSEIPHSVDIRDLPEGPLYIPYPMYKMASYLIKVNIENESLQKIMEEKNVNDEKIASLVYDWMQKNYGKYKIKRIW